MIDGWICVLAAGGDADPLVRLVDVPMTLSGLSHFNVENALAAASAALGVGLPREAVAEGLRTFEPGPEHNPGRMNIYSLGEVTVVVDLAHNESGLDALLEIMNGLLAPGARILLAMGTAGDRSDELLQSLGAIAARGSDVLVIVHKLSYLRGRTTDELDRLYRAGAAEVGVEEVPSFDTEIAGLTALVGRSRPRDVIGLMCHQDRTEVDEWLRDQGGSPDSPAVLRDKVLLARDDGDSERPR